MTLSQTKLMTSNDPKSFLKSTLIFISLARSHTQEGGIGLLYLKRFTCDNHVVLVVNTNYY